MLAAFNGIWKGIEWRLRRLHTRTVDLFNAIWKGVQWRLYPLYTRAVYRLTFLRRRSLRRTIFIGITGSAGKTTTKDLVASILERHFPRGRKALGTANGPMDAVRLVLGTRTSDAYCVTEIALTGYGIDLPIALVRPTVGVVTNIGGDHFSHYGGLDGLAEQKVKLIKSLPADGIAILNADDPRVLAMKSQFSGRTVTYGMSPDAMLRGETVESSWPDRLSFTVTWNGQSARVQTQLCGSHWAPVVLAALATGVAMGVPLGVAAEAVASVEPFEGRMAPVQAGDGVTFIRDDWKVPLWTIAPTFEFMRQARAKRKIIVMGTISDAPGDSSRRYGQIARQALAVADCVLFVGPQASASLRAKRDAKDQLFAFHSVRDASTYLSGYLRPGDLVLLKGSTRTDHLERLLFARTSGVECWRSACGRIYFCNECRLMHVASDPQGAMAIATNPMIDAVEPILEASSPRGRSEVVVIGLGNPEAHRSDTRHNVGFRAVEILARRIGQDWVFERDLAKVCYGELDGRPICLVKPLVPMNDIGPPLLQIAKALNFDVSQCILVHDDLDLPLGAVRARNRGGDGGHRGVRSILQAFQDDRFRRVKIGIGKPGAGQSIVDYVLTPFPPDQLAAVDAANRAAADRVIELIREQSPSRSSLTHEEVV